MMREKLQKVLADLGLGSRRKIEQWIAAGRITVNGKPAEIGLRVDATARITLDGKPIRRQPKNSLKKRVIMYNKPEGQICSRDDPENRPTVFQALPPSDSGRWIIVGRLDYNSAGLLLFTNDGDFAHQLMHPSSNLEREYAVRIFGRVDGDKLCRLQQGVELEDGLARFNRITHTGHQGINNWYHVTLFEGRNREVRRLWHSQDVKISRLIRVRYAGIELPRDLKPGRWRELSHLDIEMLAKGIKKNA
jgi:23S rRNA pseudouridine2605 synthase